ncbi:MAG: SDR family NAD(P)-dependent oxidoreductase [Kamptonema sp. SIO4C4]|nr:SDR family NAD(P)-dependent oxidoreductase [Kamptonema sp. SIO4C4]
MNTYQQPKTALVTGGNRGIGLAVCQGLLEEGFEVILAARSLHRARTALSHLNREGKTVRLVELDVTNEHSIDRAVDELYQELDSLNVLVNNAGVYPDEEVDILTVSRELLQLAMDTNTFGAIRVTQKLFPLLKKATAAKVINVSSGYGAWENLSSAVPSYSLSKLALNGATKLLADALKPAGIAVFAMCPGWVRTEMGGDAAPRDPEEGADTVIWLATEVSLMQTGKFFRDRQLIEY